MYPTYQVITHGWNQEPSTLFFASFEELLDWTPMIVQSRRKVHASIWSPTGRLVPLSANEYGRFRDLALSLGAEVFA